MMIEVQTAQVYFSSLRGRRFFTKASAIRAEAIGIIKRKYPTENDRPIYENGILVASYYWHWTQLPNSEKLLRRIEKLVAKTVSPSPTDKEE